MAGANVGLAGSGLLSEDEKNSALAAGLLSFGGAMMAGNRPGVPLGGLVGQAGSAGLAGYQGAINQAINAKMMPFQLQDMVLKNQKAFLENQQAMREENYRRALLGLPPLAENPLDQSPVSRMVSPAQQQGYDTGNGIPMQYAGKSLAQLLEMSRLGDTTAASIGAQLSAAAGDKQAADMFGKYALSGNPEAVARNKAAENGMVWNPSSRQFQVLPGYSSGLAANAGATKGAESAAQYPYQVKLERLKTDEGIRSAAPTAMGRAIGELSGKLAPADTQPAPPATPVGPVSQGKPIPPASSPMTLQQAAERAQTLGTKQGEMDAAREKEQRSAIPLLNVIAEAESILPKATGSVAGAYADEIAGMFGKATEGANATSQLKVLQAKMMMAMPRMEGPQSDPDVKLYRESAAEVSNPFLPVKRRQAALETLKALYFKYNSGEMYSMPGGGQPKNVSVPDPLGIR